MRYKLICCEVFTREVCFSIFQSLNIIDIEFTSKALHEKPDVLRSTLQQIIDRTEEKGVYDAILLGFGICGNGTLGVKSNSIPLVIPRAHDCCTIFLGSKEKFYNNFKDNFSKEWTSLGYIERGTSYLHETDTGKMLGLDNSYEDFVEKYGEENAKYLWETLHPNKNDDEIIFIDMPEISREIQLKNIQNILEKDTKKIRILKGDIRILKNLVDGNWSEDEFLIVPPNMKIKACYDHDKILTV